MKCPYCGAETSGRKCEYCASELPTEPEQGRCPQCGNTHIRFQRERTATTTQSVSRRHFLRSRGETVSHSTYRTVGLCQSCGHTWYPQGASSAPTRNNTWLWVMGWLFLFPVPLTILLLRKKDMKPALKYTLIAAAWLLYFFIGLTGSAEAPAGEQPVQALQALTALLL